MATAKMMFKEVAEKEVVFDNSVIQDNHKVTLGILYNNNRNEKELVVYDTHNWSGDVTGAYPTIPFSNIGEYEVFIHQGLEGSKGGVVYVDGTDTTSRKWLVAFDTPNNKCHVEAGPIGATDWNAVEVLLNQADTDSHHTDPVFEGRAAARFRGDDGNKRRLEVLFVN
ncbi:uncharacterized protein LOC141646287 [Silene latifolia]|uniref:uncharacterized protein LOC141646287 n=1 Tax=Silene latifolia TaxID=37657 RepID=UPI003D772D0C